jgi:hypothetical protein
MKSATAVICALALAACGGGGGDGGGDGGSGNDGGSTSQIDTANPSIAACFTVPNKVSFALTSIGSTGYYVKRTVEPRIINNQAVTVETSFYEDGESDVSAWVITDKGISASALDDAGSLLDPLAVMPLNMKPGEFINYTVVVMEVSMPMRMTFVGFETLTLKDKKFANTCHFVVQHMSAPPDPSTGIFFSRDPLGSWYAPGYGDIKTEVAPNLALQYDGDL